MSQENVAIGRWAWSFDIHRRGDRGEALATSFYEVCTLRDGKIIRVDEFTERGEALAAAGLWE